MIMEKMTGNTGWDYRIGEDFMAEEISMLIPAWWLRIRSALGKGEELGKWMCSIYKTWRLDNMKLCEQTESNSTWLEYRLREF